MISDVRTDMQMVSIGELGGRVRHLKFDLNAFAELENRFGNTEAAMDALQKGSLTAIKFILWAGLLHDEVILDEFTGEPVKYLITPYLVGSWVTPANLPKISEQLGAALGAGLPKQESTPDAKQLDVFELDPTTAKVVMTAEEEAEAKNE